MVLLGRFDGALANGRDLRTVMLVGGLRGMWIDDGAAVRSWLEWQICGGLQEVLMHLSVPPIKVWFHAVYVEWEVDDVAVAAGTMGAHSVSRDTHLSILGSGIVVCQLGFHSPRSRECLLSRSVSMPCRLSAAPPSLMLLQRMLLCCAFRLAL